MKDKQFIRPKKKDLYLKNKKKKHSLHIKTEF